MERERGFTRREAQVLPARLDQRVAAVAGEAWGVVSTRELIACGLSYGEIATRRRAGWLHRIHRGTYAVGHASPPWQGRLLAAAKACGPRAVLSHFSAAALWEFIEYDPNRYPDVTVPGSGGHRHRGIRTHRTLMLPPHDRSRAQGVPVTTPARTLLDLASTLDGPALRSAIRSAQGLKRVNLRQLHEVLARLGPCRGSRRLGAVIATGPAPTKSVLEGALLDLLLGGGFAHPDVNKALSIRGRRVVPDFRWPEQQLVIEADGAAWHDEKVAREEDAERQALLEAAGERVLRVTWAQVLSRPTQTLARIARAGAPRAR